MFRTPENPAGRSDTTLLMVGEGARESLSGTGVGASISPSLEALRAAGRCLAADIPGFSLSRGRAILVCPGDGFVVGGAGLQAAVQDADEAVAELAQRGLVSDLPVSHRVVVGPGSG